MTFIRIIPFFLISISLSGCFNAKATTEDLPPVNVEIIDAEIEIIDNTIGYAIILD